ncbi:hypothetical protein [Thalassobaculum sp.]|uniref:hypothetical protein n=1 Tax=Thalassobaculum sp. TaxID=2022740 RepID=UPI0032ED862D
MALNQAQAREHLNVIAVETGSTALLRLLTAFVDGDFNAVAGVTASAAEINVLDGLNVPQAELKAVDPSQKVVFFDDFLAAGIDGRISSTAGSGTGNQAATTVANGLNGRITLKSASDDGTHAANCTSLTLDQLNFKASEGNLAIEVRLAIDDVSEAVLFVGFTDTISTTVELPIFMNAADIDSDATDAAGIVYDVDATTKQWCHGGVKAGADTTPAYSGTAPTDGTMVTLRAEITSAGALIGYVNGVAIGAAIADAVTTSVALTPCIVIGNRSANQVTATVDYIHVMQGRTS